MTQETDTRHIKVNYLGEAPAPEPVTDKHEYNDEVKVGMEYAKLLFGPRLGRVIGPIFAHATAHLTLRDLKEFEPQENTERDSGVKVFEVTLEPGTEAIS